MSDDGHACIERGFVSEVDQESVVVREFPAIAARMCASDGDLNAIHFLLNE